MRIKQKKKEEKWNEIEWVKGQNRDDDANFIQTNIEPVEADKEH